MSDFLTGEALRQHEKETFEFASKLQEKWKDIPPEGSLEFHASMLGDEYPEWQMRTDCVTAFVEDKGWTLEHALEHFKLTESEYRNNLKRIEAGEGE